MGEGCTEPSRACKPCRALPCFWRALPPSATLLAPSSARPLRAVTLAFWGLPATKCCKYAVERPLDKTRGRMTAYLQHLLASSPQNTIVTASLQCEGPSLQILRPPGRPILTGKIHTMRHLVAVTLAFWGP